MVNSFFELLYLYLKWSVYIGYIYVTLHEVMQKYIFQTKYSNKKNLNYFDNFL